MRLPSHQGYVLMPVLITVTLIASIALLASIEGSSFRQQSQAELTSRQADYVAEAGHQHAQRQLRQNTSCINYANVPLTAFGQHSYLANVSPTEGSPVVIAAVSNMKDGSTSAVSQTTLKMYQPSTTETLELGTHTGKDTFIYEWKANWNYGLKNQIWVTDVFSDSTAHGLIYFDLSNLPPQVEILNATLELYQNSPAAGGGKVGAHRITTEWSEGTRSGGAGASNWTERSSGAGWSQVGGDFGKIALATTTVSKKTKAWYQWDITNQTQRWLDGVQPNHGLALVPQPGADAYFASSQLTDLTLRPKLTLRYACECGATYDTATSTISPIADTTLAAGIDQNNNFEAVPELMASGDGSSDDHALLLFNLDAIPSGALLNSASLNLYFEGNSSSGSTNVHAFRVTRDWSPTAVNWLRYDTGIGWSTLGGDFDATSYASAPITADEFGPKSWDISQLVSEWLSGTHPNYGVLLHAETGFNNVIFTSNEGTVSNRPTLIVSYSCPCGADCQNGGESGSGAQDSCPGNFLDAFNSQNYNGNDGTLTWLADWAEVGESDGATSGDILIEADLNNYSLRTQDNDNDGEGVQRAANLSNATSATLSYDYRRSKLDNGSDYTSIEVSANGAAGPWTELARLQGSADDPDYISGSHDISAHISANTMIRLKTSPSLGNNDAVFFDNVEITCGP